MQTDKKKLNQYKKFQALKIDASRHFCCSWSSIKKKGAGEVIPYLKSVFQQNEFDISYALDYSRW